MHSVLRLTKFKQKATLVLMFSLMMFSHAAFSISGNVSALYGQNLFAIDSDIEFKNLEIESNIQKGDNEYLIKANAGITANIFGISGKLSFDNTITTIGRDNTITASTGVTVKGVEWHIGVFGKDSNPFGASPLFDKYKDVVDEEDWEATNLTSALMEVPEHSLWGISLESAFDVNIAEVSIKALLDPRNELHQAKIDVGTSGNIERIEGLGWTAKGDITVQSYKGNLEALPITYVGLQYTF